MATPEKVRACRANAQKSTGPKTLEGKKVSRSNSITHGAYASPVSLHPEEQPLWEEFRADVMQELDPAGPLERELAEGIAWTLWRLHKLRSKEAALMVLLETRRRLGLLRRRMSDRCWKALENSPARTELMATDEEIEQRAAMAHKIEILEAETVRPEPELEERHAAVENHLQRTLMKQLATYYALKDRREPRT